VAQDRQPKQITTIGEKRTKEEVEADARTKARRHKKGPEMVDLDDV